MQFPKWCIWEPPVALTGNDTALFEALLKVFIQNNSTYISNINAAICTKNSTDLKFYAHQAKSGLASIGATIASQFATKMEDMGEKSDFNNINEIFKVFREELELIEEYIKNKDWINEVNEYGKEKGISY